MPTAIRSVLGFLEGLGAPSQERTSERVDRQLVVFGGALMSLGGLVWGTLSLSQGLVFACSIPYGYTALTILNFTWLGKTRQLDGPKRVQVLMSLLLPFFFQWSLGGFVHSGGVMLWSIIALVGSLTFSNARQASLWLAMYCALTIASGLMDAHLAANAPFSPSPQMIRVFFVLNVTTISSIVFALTLTLSLRQRDAIAAAGAEQEISGRLAQQLLVVLGERERDIERLRGAEEQLAQRVDERTAELRAALQHAEAAARAKTDFLATMSHEIRTPLNGILGTADFLQTTSLDATQAESLRVVRRSGELLLNILNDVLDFSRIEAGKLSLVSRQFDPRADVLAVVGLHRAAAAKKGVQVFAMFNESVPTRVEGDSGRLMQVVGNLLANAVKFTEHGKVTIIVRAEELEHARVRLSFAVTDTGIGIPADQLPRLFTPFTQVDSSNTRAYGGSGLGLSICARLVEKFGGSITAESTEGNGTTVSFDVVLERATRLAAPSGQLSRLTSLEGMQVLVVEDNRVNQAVATRLIERLGAKVTVASDGLEALERVKAQRFDVVLMDVQMPRLDGIGATRAIRELKLAAQPRIVALTANAYESDVAQCLAAGMDDFLSKPLRLEALHQTLAREVSRAS